jgi:Ca2+-binding EF-hand superfamily protein
LETFQAIFDIIDADKGGKIDQTEFYGSLIAAGIQDITEEGVLTLFAMIDDDGSCTFASITLLNT